MEIVTWHLNKKYGHVDKSGRQLVNRLELKFNETQKQMSLMKASDSKKYCMVVQNRGYFLLSPPKFNF